jgi:HTH-type transcriptional regulator, transcriptional repressor of NAD biosynthesis genes
VGKSGLAIQLAEIFNTNYVLEQARNIIVTNDFSVAEIIKIGEAQTNATIEALEKANEVLFCDTDLITTQIYSQYYLNQVPEILFDLEKKVEFDLYFLLDIDIEWVADGLRDLGHKRKEMYHIFEAELARRNIDYVKVFGPWPNRVKIVMDTLKNRFNLAPNTNI